MSKASLETNVSSQARKLSREANQGSIKLIHSTLFTVTRILCTLSRFLHTDTSAIQRFLHTIRANFCSVQTLLGSSS